MNSVQLVAWAAHASIDSFESRSSWTNGQFSCAAAMRPRSPSRAARMTAKPVLRRPRAISRPLPDTSENEADEGVISRAHH
eukprot:1088667-Pleurochrysis_carterae.AAC.1